MLEKTIDSFRRLKAYCETEDFKGWDPFDGLTSRVFRSLPVIRDSSLMRLAWIQAFKKNPVNLRPVMLIRKDYNAKGLGLFLNGYCNLYQVDPRQEYLDKIDRLASQLIELKNHGFSGACWGYNFDWQSKAFFQPKFTPTVVASTFIGYALLDAFDLTKREEYKKTALSVCDFILKDLNRTPDEDGDLSFSYSPIDQTQVYNATLLASRMLARAYSYTHNKELLEPARKSVAYCCKNQKEDGSWTYSPLPFHQWIDNFHTGYNLECISEYQKHSGDNSFQMHIEKGLKYYMETFFTPGGMPKYYNNSIYPVDVHAPAQLVITLSRLEKNEVYANIIDKVLSWTIDNMQSKKGYFYYQKNALYTVKIPYIRWAQAWMFYALSTYLKVHMTSV